MIKALRLAIATLFLAIVVPSVSQADIILSYTGQLFTEIGGTAFSNADRITAIVTFENIGAPNAKAFSMSTTMQGGNGFTFEWNGNTNDFTQVTNTFVWKDSALSAWDLLAVRNVAGDSADEMLAIHEGFGDQAFLDLTSDNQSSGASVWGNHGKWAVVPEPSSMALFAVGAVLGFAVLRRRRGR